VGPEQRQFEHLDRRFDFLYKGTYGAWGLEGTANFLRF